MDDYISRQRTKDYIKSQDSRLFIGLTIGEAVRMMIDEVPAADVVEVHAVIDRMNKERKRAKGNWHTDPYWLGWVDAMRRAERIVDGTIDDEPMYAPSTGEKKEDKQG